MQLCWFYDLTNIKKLNSFFNRHGESYVSNIVWAVCLQGQDSEDWRDSEFKYLYHTGIGIEPELLTARHISMVSSPVGQGIRVPTLSGCQNLGEGLVSEQSETVRDIVWLFPLKDVRKARSVIHSEQGSTGLKWRFKGGSGLPWRLRGAFVWEPSSLITALFPQLESWDLMGPRWILGFRERFWRLRGNYFGWSWFGVLPAGLLYVSPAPWCALHTFGLA